MLLLLAVFVGNAACRPCHQDIVRKYEQTPMALTSGVVKQVPSGSFHHAASGVTYTLKQSVIHSRAGDQALHYFIGSAAAARSYLFSLDGYLFQSPATWYAQRRIWDMSPGYEGDRYARMNRPVEAGCLFCHASQVVAASGTQNRYAADPPFQQPGIGCERCHGPGSDHVAGKGGMVNPARLPAAERDSVCAQCHLAGEVRVHKPGKHLARFQPGERLYDYVTHFVYEPDPAGLKVTSHVEKFDRSACKQASGDRMWCGSCHDPHEVPSAAKRAAFFRGRCMACHQQAHRAKEDCTSCHMPRMKTSDGGHSVLTDHSIPRARSSRQTTGPMRLTAYKQIADARSLGLALAEVGGQDEEAFRLLSEAVRQYPNDGDVLARLGYLLERRGESVRAGALYRAAVVANPAGVMAPVNLGSIEGREGRLEEAVRWWRIALQRNPGLTEASLNLAAALRQLRRDAEAAEVLNRARRFDPDHPSLARLSQ